MLYLILWLRQHRLAAGLGITPASKEREYINEGPEYCEVCNFHTATELEMRSHKAGIRHIENEKCKVRRFIIISTAPARKQFAEEKFLMVCLIVCRWRLRTVMGCGSRLPPTRTPWIRPGSQCRTSRAGAGLT